MVLPMTVPTFETHEIFQEKSGWKLKASITCK